MRHQRHIFSYVLNGKYRVPFIHAKTRTILITGHVFKHSTDWSRCSQLCIISLLCTNIPTTLQVILTDVIKHRYG